MRSILILILVCAIAYCHGQSIPETQKIGHADWEYIFSKLPEYKKIESDLKVFETQLQNQVKIKRQELETKFASYRALPADTPQTIKKDKEEELAYLEQNLQRFQQDAQASMQKKQTDLITPVFTRVEKAIEEVAHENGYAYIINPLLVGGGNVLLFADAKNNVSNMVLKKLGVE
ncbi:MAG TPA: OmpH family outer membrane protein [Chryseolinea sp.]